METSDRQSRITTTLRECLEPVHIEVVDESHLHVGHAGAKSGAGHYRVIIVSDRFEGMSRIERQRLVYGALSEEMGPDIHALSMKTFTRVEWQK